MAKKLEGSFNFKSERGRKLESFYFNYDKDELKKEEDSISARDLTKSSVPPKRDGKRHNDKLKWRGEQQTKNVIAAIYTLDSYETPTKPNSFKGTRNVGPYDLGPANRDKNARRVI